MHKTGTSAIQLALLKLPSENYDVLTVDKFGNASTIVNCSSNAEYSINSKLDKLLKNAKKDTAILSAEHLFFLNEKESIVYLREKLSVVYDNIQVYVYLRRQDLAALSFKQQASKGSIKGQMPSSILMGHSESPLPEINEDVLRYYLYAEKLESWFDVFGRSNVHARNYDRNFLVNGDVVEDFSEWTGLPIKKNDVQVNNGVSLKFSLINHKLLEFDTSKELVLSVRRKMNFSMEKIQPSKEHMLNFYNNFSKSNERLCKIFFSEEKAFFSEVIDSYPVKTNYIFADDYYNELENIFLDIGTDEALFTVELLKMDRSLKKRQDGTLLVDNVYGKYSFTDPQKPLVITFSNAAETTRPQDIRDVNYSPWGFEFLKKKGVNVISFSSVGAANWYRSRKFIAFIERLSPILQNFSIKLGYGGSMGGYAAGAFANLLQLDRVLLINPFSSLNKDLAPWEKRFERSANILNWHSHYHDGADLSCAGMIVYDPIFEMDAKHAKRYSGLKHVRFPGVGHSLPKHLHLLGLLDMLVDSLIKDNFDESRFYKKLRARRFYPRYYQWLLSKENRHLTKARAKIIKIHRDCVIRLSDNVSDVLIQNNYVDLLRNDAIKLEKTDLKMAYALMKRALELRPNGPVIKRKVSEYEQLLGISH